MLIACVLGAAGLGDKVDKLTEAEVDDEAPLRAVTKLHGAFKVQFSCAQRGAGVFLNALSTFWRTSRPKSEEAEGSLARVVAAPPRLSTWDNSPWTGRGTAAAVPRG